jgi:hypothetical protein
MPVNVNQTIRSISINNVSRTITITYPQTSGGGSSSQGSQYNINYADGAGGWTASPTIVTDASGNLTLNDIYFSGTDWRTATTPTYYGLLRNTGTYDEESFGFSTFTLSLETAMEEFRFLKHETSSPYNAQYTAGFKNIWVEDKGNYTGHVLVTDGQGNSNYIEALNFTLTSTATTAPFIGTDAAGDNIEITSGNDGLDQLNLKANTRLGLNNAGSLVEYWQNLGTDVRRTTYSGRGFYFLSGIADASSNSAGHIFNNGQVTTKDIASFQSAGTEKAKVDADGNILGLSYTITSDAVVDPVISTDTSGNLILSSGGGFDRDNRLQFSSDGINIHNQSDLLILSFRNSVWTTFSSNVHTFYSDVDNTSTETAGHVFNNQNVTTKDIASYRSNEVEKAKIDVDGKIYSADGLIGFDLANPGWRSIDGSQSGLIFTPVNAGRFSMSNTTAVLSSGMSFGWTSTGDVTGTVFSTLDTYFKRDSAGVLRVHNSTGTGELITNKPYATKTANYTMTASDYGVNCTSGTFSIFLPTSSGITGTEYEIINTGTGAITVDPNGSETINGNTTIILFKDEVLTVKSDGTNWIMI